MIEKIQFGGPAELNMSKCLAHLAHWHNLVIKEMQLSLAISRRLLRLPQWHIVTCKVVDVEAITTRPPGNTYTPFVLDSNERHGV